MESQEEIFNQLRDELQVLKNNVTDSLNELKLEKNKYSSEFTNFQNQIKTALGSATSDSASISNTLSNVQRYQADIAQTKNEISQVQSQYDENVQEYTELIEFINKEYNQFKEKISNENDNLSKLRKALFAEQEKINKILGDANRASMAQSFLDRKKELDAPIKNSASWRNWGLVGMAGMLFVVLIYEWYIGFDYIRFLTRLPMITPWVWLVWVNSQRNAHLVRVQEEYAHKASVALAFEGYQRKVEELDDPNIKKLLLELSVHNLGENPVNLFDKNVKSSPVEGSIFSKMAEKYFAKTDKE